MVKTSQEKKEYINKKFKDLFEMLNNLKRLNKELYDYKNLRRTLELSYIKNRIDRNIYIEEINKINKKILDLESEILVTLGRMKGAIGLIVEDLYKSEGKVSKEKKESPIRTIRKVISDVGSYLYSPKYERKILEIEKELEKAEEIELDKRILPFIEKSKKEKKKEDIILLNKKILKRMRKEEKKLEIDIPRIFISISNRIFGDISDIILEKFPNFYYIIKTYIRRFGLNLTPKIFLSILFTVLTFSVIVGIVLFLFIFKIWAIVLPLALIILSLSIIFLFLEYSKNTKRNSIDNNLPFAIIHMLSLLQTGVDIEKVFFLLSEIEEYGYLSKEFKRISDLLSIGVSLTDTLIHIRDTTVSERFSEFLDELLLTLKSGRSIKDFFITYSEMQLALYRSDLEKLNQTMKTFSDLYVGIILTVPMIFISIAVMLATISEKIFGMTLSQFLSVITLILIPIVNIGFLIFISKLET